MNKVNEVQPPLNHQEQYLYGINVRLEVLIDQFSSLLSHIASTQGVAVEEAKVEEVKVENVKTVRASRKG